MRLLIACVMLAAPPLFAAEVFVNGVSIEGVTDQTFEKASVRIDGKGNVHITAPGYTIKRVGAEREAKQVSEPNRGDAILSKRYFLVTEQRPPGATEYDIEVFIGDKFLRTLRSTEDQIILEVTKQLRPGKNVFTLQAKKHITAGKPKSTDSTAVFRVLIGEAVVNDEQVVLEKTLINFSRNASEMNDIVQEFTLTTR